MLEYSSFQENNITAKERKGIPGIVHLTRNGKFFFASWRLCARCVFPERGLLPFPKTNNVFFNN
jgi:hypothetical protein